MLKDKRFWTVVFTQAIAIATYFAAKYAAPVLLEDIVFIIGVIEAFGGMIFVLIWQEKIRIEEALIAYSLPYRMAKEEEAHPEWKREASSTSTTSLRYP
jgi:hypothetical protein